MKRALLLLLIWSCAPREARPVEIAPVALNAPVERASEDPKIYDASSKQKERDDDLQGALDDALKALEIRERELGADHPEVARSLVRVGDRHRALGHWAEVVASADRAMRILERDEGSLDYGRALELRASDVLHARRYEEARTMLERVKQIYDRFPKEEEEQIDVLEDLAVVEYGVGNYPRAIEIYKKALERGERYYGKSSDKIAGVVGGLGLCYRYTHDDANARAFLERAVELREGRASPALSAVLNNLATYYHDHNELAKAEPLYRRAVSIAERAYGPDDVTTGQEYMNLGHVLMQMGDAREGEGWFQRGLDVFERRLGKTHPEYVRSANLFRQLKPSP